MDGAAWSTAAPARRSRSAAPRRFQRSRWRREPTRSRSPTLYAALDARCCRTHRGRLEAQRHGHAQRHALQLTNATTTFAAGSAFWPTALDPRALRIDFDATIGGGSGADGLAFVFGDATRGASRARSAIAAAASASPASPGSRSRSTPTRIGQPVGQLRRHHRRPRLRGPRSDPLARHPTSHRRCAAHAPRHDHHHRDDADRRSRRHASALPGRDAPDQRLPRFQRRHRRPDRSPRDRASGRDCGLSAAGARAVPISARGLI